MFGLISAGAGLIGEASGIVDEVGGIVGDIGGFFGIGGGGGGGAYGPFSAGSQPNPGQPSDQEIRAMLDAAPPPVLSSLRQAWDQNIAPLGDYPSFDGAHPWLVGKVATGGGDGSHDARSQPVGSAFSAAMQQYRSGAFSRTRTGGGGSVGTQGGALAAVTGGMPLPLIVGGSVGVVLLVVIVILLMRS